RYFSHPENPNMRRPLVLFSLIIFSANLFAQTPQGAVWSSDSAKQVDDVVSKALAVTGVPSASIAVVVENKIVYQHAYGEANVEKHRPASTEMRYSIGSISKQFCSTAVLLLAEQGK